MNRLREEALATDPILAAHSSEETVRCVIEQLAREAAGLRWEREQAQSRGLDSAAMISSRRVDALSKLATLIVDARKHGVYGTQPSPAKLALIKTFWLQSIGAIAFEALPTDIAETLMTRYAAAIADVDLAALLNE